MSRGNGPKLDLKLNLSPPRLNLGCQVESPSRSLTVSPPSSCVSSELNQQNEYLRYSTSPEATSMMLVGCPRCLMYVMLAEEDPRCPKCKSTVLLDVIHDDATPRCHGFKDKEALELARMHSEGEKKLERSVVLASTTPPAPSQSKSKDF